jgi:hypothetical protein
MKKITILFAIAVALFASCREENDNFASFTIDKPEGIFAAPEGGIEYIQVSSTEEWTASANQPWISVSPANGIGQTKCSIFVDSTLSNNVREAKLTFETTEGDRYTVMIEQAGFGKFINLKDSTITIEAATNRISDRYFEIEVGSNVNFKISVVDSLDNPITWLTPKNAEVKPNLDRPSRPRSTKVRFDWKINSDTIDRVAFVNFLPLEETDKLEKAATLTLIQEAAPVIPDNRLGDSLAVVTIINRLQLLSPWDMSENMQYWENVKLWYSTDKEILNGEVPREAIGRVREANFMMSNTKESIPLELRYLKYIETLNIYSNVNTMLLSIELGSEICDLEYLKHLQIGAFGLVSLPDDFVKLGDKLESLDLNSNNFPEVPSILTPENFPKLKKLDLLACRRWTVSDLRKKDNYEDGIGMHFRSTVNEDNSLRRLLLWENLEELRLSNNYIEGQIPDFKVGEDGVVAWSAADVAAWGGDTIKNLALEERPKILPNMKRLTLNLNFFTGKLPGWLLYHPHLLDWFPESLVYMQQVNAYDSEGKPSKFDNEPTDYEYYFNFFPGYREKYEIKEEFED